MKIDVAVSQFMTTIENAVTKSSYSRALKDFFLDYEYLKDITQQDANEYIHSIRKQKPQTISARLSAIRSFYTYCLDNGWVAWAPEFKNKPAKRYDNPTNLSMDEFTKILGTFDTNELEGARNLLLLRVVFLLGDQRQAIELPFNTKFNDPTTETLKTKYVELLAQVVNIIKFEVGYLFVDLKDPKPHKHINTRKIRTIIEAAAQKVGIERVNVFSLKFLRAKQIYEQTGSAEAVRDFCGHSSLVVTRQLINSF